MSHCRNDAGVAFGYSDIDRDALAWREEIYQDKVAWHRFHLVWSGGRLDTVAHELVGWRSQCGAGRRCSRLVCGDMECVSFGLVRGVQAFWKPLAASAGGFRAVRGGSSAGRIHPAPFGRS